MTLKQKKGLRGSIDDVLGDLLGDEDDEGPAKVRSPAAGPSKPTGVLTSRSGKRSLIDDDFFSKLAAEAERTDEGSDVSEADPAALLDTMKNMDDMDADLFSSKKKPSSAPVQRKEDDASTLPDKSKASDKMVPEEKKPSSAPASTARSYKKFSFLDNADDSLDDLLGDLEPKQDKKKTNTTKMTLSSSPAASRKTETVSPAARARRRDDLMFDDDEDDLMDALGFVETPKTQATEPIQKKESDTPQRARTRLDEILGRGTSPRLLERPVTGEKKETRAPENPTEKISEVKGSVMDEEDVTFGSYQPTMGSTPEGRQSRRQSVRFSTEDVSVHSPEHKAKPSTPTSTRATRPRSDWLGLKQEEEEPKIKEDPKQTAPETLKPPASPSRKPSSQETHAMKTTEPAVVPSSPQPTRRQVRREDDEEDDWLSGALSRKKAQFIGQSEERERKQESSLVLGEEAKSNSSSTSRRRPDEPPASGREPSLDPADIPNTTREDQQKPEPSASGQNLSSRSTELQSRLFNTHKPSEPRRQDIRTSAERDMTAIAPPAVCLLQQTSPADGAVPLSQTPADHLQHLLMQQQLAQSQLWSLSSHQKHSRDADETSGDMMTSLQTRIIQLEGQLRSLKLDRDQKHMLLESVQERHKQDALLMENMHRARVKLLEESAAQRELRARQENEDLAERLAGATRMAEQERAELQTQYLRRLTQCQQDRDREVERLRDLQRKSILEMKRDHEDQIQRLKKLKDEEIDAVTSATSQTRSLTVVIEQMEQFSRRLGDVSSRVESTHENTAQGLELGARQRDEQLRVLQDRLGQQHREMSEERTRLKEVIAKMDTQLAEQQRQLEKERWRVTSEQAKAESALRGLDEERRTVMHQFSMEREELEKAKSALLEEQQSVMQHCAEERRKLAAEWTRFHTQEKMRQERVEKEASRALERDAQREGSIINMAQEQAELKLRAGELKQKEESLQRERDGLEKMRQELESEREKLSTAALRLKTRAEEVESFSKLASERFEEGERAVREARQLDTQHQSRLHNIRTQMERLRQQEQSLQQERLRMTDHRRDVDRLRHSFPVHPPAITEFSPAFTSTHMTSAASPELHAKLALIKHTAEKDRDFLQEEQYFLDTLKKTSYNLNT